MRAQIFKLIAPVLQLGITFKHIGFNAAAVEDVEINRPLRHKNPVRIIEQAQPLIAVVTRSRQCGIPFGFSRAQSKLSRSHTCLGSLKIRTMCVGLRQRLIEGHDHKRHRRRRICNRKILPDRQPDNASQRQLVFRQLVLINHKRLLPLLQLHF